MKQPKLLWQHVGQVMPHQVTALLGIRTSTHLDRSAQRTALDPAFCSSLLAKRFPLPHITSRTFSSSSHDKQAPQDRQTSQVFSLAHFAPQRFPADKAPLKLLCRVCDLETVAYGFALLGFDQPTTSNPATKCYGYERGWKAPKAQPEPQASFSPDVTLVCQHEAAKAAVAACWPGYATSGDFYL